MKRFIYYLEVLCLTCTLWACSDLQEPIVDDALQLSPAAQKANYAGSKSVSSVDIDRVIQRVKDKITAYEKQSRTGIKTDIVSRDDFRLCI
ncbi:MAG: hypothetical protein IJ808_09440 [Muribaculaceae bacterium]|nr:hypothetical protein [Muribaculaceae bacterium]